MSGSVQKEDLASFEFCDKVVNDVFKFSIAEGEAV